jgi:hypothetical protein
MNQGKSTILRKFFKENARNLAIGGGEVGAIMRSRGVHVSQATISAVKRELVKNGATAPEPNGESNGHLDGALLVKVQQCANELGGRKNMDQYLNALQELGAVQG